MTTTTCQKLSVTGEDGAIVLTLHVPQLPRVSSAPNMRGMDKMVANDVTNNSTAGIPGTSKGPTKPKTVGKANHHRENEKGINGETKEKKVKKKEKKKEQGDEKKEKMEMTKTELVKKYRLHFFVFIIFLAAVILVSLSWYYREKSLRTLQSTQTIFFDPRERLLTLTDPTDTRSIRGRLGLDMPEWQLPLHCPVVVNEDPSSRQCEWKSNANLSINHFGNAHVQCYNVTWDSVHIEHVPYDCFEVGDSAWYGPSNQSQSTFPIRGQFYYKPTNQRLDNNGVFGHVEDFYWLSSAGAALRVHGDGPVHVFWNRTGDSRLCLLANYTGPLFHRGHHSHLEYTLCNGINSLRTHSYMQEIFPPSSPVTFPADNVFRGYFWSFKGFSSSSSGNLSQHSVMEFANRLSSYNQSHAKVVIDTAWQASQGDLTFDPAMFPNIGDLVSTLDDLQSQLTFVVQPSIHFTSFNFEKGIDSSMFVLDASGEVSGLVKTKQGVAAVVDVFNMAARRWYRNRIKDVVNQLPGSSLRLSYGPNAWLPYKPHFDSPHGSPRGHRTRLSETVSMTSHPLVVEHTADTRHLGHLIPVATNVTITSDRKCMVGAIETTLTLGMMGYPFVLLESPDLDRPAPGLRNESRDEIELFIRWLQLAAFFPASQISFPPWLYDLEVISAAINATSLHEELMLPLLGDRELRSEVVSQGMPILRPVWWLDDDNQTVHDMKITDEFLVGDVILVAPVMCTGMRSRDIYVPPGVWEDKKRKIFILGPKTLINYNVPLHSIAVFHRHQVEGETTK